MSLPRYSSHKIVRAAKISSIGPDTNGTHNLNLRLPNGDIQSYGVSPDYVKKHEPKVGGYLVVYEDGYESWSPADAFEQGYTLSPETEGSGG